MKKDEKLEKCFAFADRMFSQIEEARKKWFEERNEEVELLKKENGILKSKISWASIIMTLLKISTRKEKNYDMPGKELIRLADGVLDELK